MCGIAGVLKFEGQVEESTIKKMTDILAHRGPNGEGHWLNTGKYVGLGHRRLAIIDLSKYAAQPMSYANERYTITFNGEIYNYLDLRKLLVQNGFDFSTSSDTEVLLAMYHWKGKDMLSLLDGMFSFAIWDAELSKLFCARDRYGEKPFYYHKSANGFYFASEMKALFAAGISPATEQTMLTNYLLNDLVVDPNNSSKTFFAQVQKLEKASYLEVYTNGKIEINKYYTINVNASINSFEGVEEKLFDLLNDSVKRRMIADVQIGSSISGGLDSSIVAYLVNENFRTAASGSKLNTFSARFKEFGFSEDEFLDCILAELKVENHTVHPNENLIHQEIQKIYYHQEEPFLSASILNQWDVMRLARQQNTTVLLDGQGADELLAGYGWYQKVHLLELATRSKKSYHEEIAGRLSNGFSKEKLDFVDWMKINLKSTREIGAKLKHYGTKKWGYNFISKNAIWHSLLNPSYCNIESVGLPLVPSYPNNLNEVLAVDFTLVLEPILRYSDRNSMAHSVEVRTPYLGHEFVDFCFNLNSSFKINHGWKKYILRKAFETKIPQKIAWRRDKMGYAAPEQKWLSSIENQTYLNDSWKDLQNRGVIKSNANLSSDISWKVLMIHEMINFSETNFEKNSSPKNYNEPIR